MDKKTIIAALVSAVVFGAGGFGAGTLLGRAGGNGGGIRFMTGAQGGVPGQDGQRGQGARGGVAVGKVTEKSADSFTIKMPDGSSRTVYFSKSTAISKVDSGSADDISVDTTVTAMGSTTSGGDITATRITIGDAMLGGGLDGLRGAGANGRNWQGNGGSGGQRVAPGDQGFGGYGQGGPAGPPPGY